MNDSKHANYEEYAKKWQRTRAACDGQDAVHSKGVLFLPKLAEQTDIDYRNYVERATYFNACGRTLEGLVGMVFRKEPSKEYPTALQSIVDDLDLSGNSIDRTAQLIMTELIRIGRFGLLVEYPQVNVEVNSQAQASALNLRPYVTHYPAESILDWRIERINNAMQPTMIKLMESYEVSKSVFEYECRPQIRALLLENGVYLQRIYRKPDGGDWTQFGDDIIPAMRGNPLTAIPFWAFGSETNSLDLQQPPILDLADLNLAHYRVNADYERGCHFAGLPTPVLAGFQFDENSKVAIGSTTCLVSSEPTAKWGFLEFTGQGLTALLDNLKAKEAQMAAVGARMLSPEKAGVEAEGTLLMRTNGETSVLASLTMMVSENLQQILQFMAEWLNVGGEIKYELSTDYVPVGLTAQELDSLVKSWQSGAISYPTLFSALKRGEIISNGTTLEDEQELIANETPVLAE
jgi:hypothetical protein